LYLPLLLIVNCFSIYLFRNKIGSLGIFISSVSTLLYSLSTIVFNLHPLSASPFYTFVDYGRWFFVYDVLDSNLVFIVDNLSTTLTTLVLLLTLFAQVFGIEYMYREAYASRLIYLLNMFATSVVFLFFVYDFFLILVVWELIGLFSLLLVNFYSQRVYTIKAALKTFFFSRISDFFISMSFFIVILLFNSSDLGVVFLQTPYFIFYNTYLFNTGFNTLNLLSLFILFSGAVKAAQFFFHVWLPDAMEAPTPASALIHSSTLVIMGIYFIVRCSSLFELSVLPNLVMVLLGSVTVAIGAIAASCQNDIKKLVAYSTISQMGYLFCGCGFLCYTEVIFYLIVHALNKAFLFILVGYIVHFFYGNTDMRFMGSAYSSVLDFTFLLFFISLNLSGLPFTAGFLAKELLVFQTMRDYTLILLVRSLWFFSFCLTPYYMFFLNWNVIFRNRQGFEVTFSNKPQSFFKKKSLFMLQGSLFNSKLSSLLYLLLFASITLFGESLVTTLYNYSNCSYVTYQLNWVLLNYQIGNSQTLLTFTVNYLFTFIIYTSLLVSTKLFFYKIRTYIV